MYTLNITYKVSHGILAEWLPWEKEKHIPEIMDTGWFSDYRFYRLMHHEDEEGDTFVLQLIMSSIEAYENFIATDDEMLRKTAYGKWGDHFIAFRTLLEHVQ